MEVTVGKEKAQPRGTKQWVWVPGLVFLQAKAIVAAQSEVKDKIIEKYMPTLPLV